MQVMAPEIPDELAIGRAIRELRTQKGWSLAQLAEVAGTTATSISRIEIGARTPSLGMLFSIAAALEISFAELVERAYGKGGEPG